MKIKRPLAIIGFTLAVAFCFTSTMPKSLVIFSLALFALFVIIHSLTRKTYTKSLILSFVVALLSLAYFENYNQNLDTKIKNYENEQSLVLQGRISQQDFYNGGTIRYTITAKLINDKRADNFSCYLYSDDILETGDKVTLTGKFKGFSVKTNKATHYSKGIYGYFYADNVEINESGFDFYSACAKLKATLINKARFLYSADTLPVVMAMGYSDKSRLSVGDTQAFRTAGLSHALVVSGLHVGIITGFMGLLMAFLPFKKRFKNIILAILVIIYMGIVGFTPSIVRAGYVAMAVLIGRSFLLEIDNLTVLGAIIGITTLINPYSGANVGLLLSYSACLGVMLAGKIAADKDLSKVALSLLITTMAVTFTLPILILFSMESTLLAPITNLILSPVIMIICVLSVITLILGCFGPLGGLINFGLVPFNELIITALLKFVYLINDKLNFALVNLSAEVFKVLIFAGLVATAFAFLQFKKARPKSIFILAVLLSTLLCYNFIVKDTVTVTAFDSGSESSFIITKGEENYLVFTEDIKQGRLSQVVTANNLTGFNKAYYCGEKPIKEGAIYNYCKDVTVITENFYENNEFFDLKAQIAAKKKEYYISVSGITFAFSHNLTVVDEPADFYFFGADTPKEVKAKTSFYFYPLSKKHKDMAEKLQAQQLNYDLKIKINTKTKTYTIVKDVRNFGDQL